MALTDPACRNAKAQEKPYKLADEKGLYLLVNSAGRYWRFDYRVAGKRKTLAFGVYPEISIKRAREKRDDARRLLDNDSDPGLVRRMQKRSAADAAANSFEVIAREWHAKFTPQWTAEHADRILRRLEADLFPWIGTRPIAEIDPPEVLAVLRRIESRGAVQTAHRAHQNCSQVFRYAVQTGRAQRDPSADLRGALAPYEEKHHASITEPKAIGELLRAIDGYKGDFVTRCALRFAALTFVRPGELRHAEWNEFDLKKAEWRIPAQKMKMDAVHIVPLSVQTLAVLEELKPLTGAGQYLFPGVRGRKRPMSENTVLGALRRLGYTTKQMTGHGFRSMASTLLNEQGFNRDWIERQLAHGERDQVRAAYNYAEHLPERRKMMQSWADYLDVLREERNVVQGNFGQAA